MSNKLISTVDDHDHGHDHAHEAKSCCSSAKRGVKAVDDHNHGHDHSHGGGGCCSSVKHVPLEDTCTSGCCSTEPVKPVDDHDHGHDHAHSGGCCSSTGKTVPPEDSCTSGCCSSEPSKAVDDHRYHNKGSCCSSDAKAERVVPSEDTCTSGCCALEPAKPASCCASEPAKPASCCSAEKTCGDGCSAECCSSSAKETKKCSSTCCSPEEEGECKKGCCEAKTPAKALVVVAASPAPSLLVVNTAPAAPTPAPLPIVKPDTKLDTKPADTIAVVVERPTVCSACDPSSPVPHTLQVTRLRVANMCCAGEEKILRQALEGATGVEQIAVNVIGRYAVIKHCATPCCTPVATLVDLLNAKHLGVSVSEVAGSDASDEEERLDRKHLSLVSLVWLLFVVGCAVSHSHPLSSDILFLVSIGLGLIPVLSAAGVALFMRRTIDISVLMTLAIAGAVAAEEYFDGSLVVALFLSAELLEAYIMLRVRAAIRASSTQMAKDAYLASGAKVAVADLKIDDVIAVRAGEMILGDGVVVKGEGVVDESALTGESVPVGKKVGAVVLSGTVVQNGYLEVRLTSNTAENTVNRLKQTIEDVQADKGTYARLVDRFAVYWTPGVLLAVLCLIVIGGAVSEDWYVFVNRGLILLVLACPCAILIAAPVPSVCAIAAAAKQGVLLKGSSVLERMASIDTIAVDKTGTLTKGFFKVTERCRLGGDDLDFDPMQLAAAIEAKSTHPLANAVVTEFTGCVADMDMVALPPVRKIQVVDGVGVTGWVEVDSDWKFVAVGNEKLLKENGGKVRTTPAQREALTAFLSRSQGKVTLLVCVEDELCLLLSLADEVRPESSTFVGEVRGRLGMTVSMITGDHRDVALKVCEAVGIPAEECHARLLPADKLSWVQTAQQETGAGKHMLMVGDGINDSTGLAAASVGVAMGAGGSAMAVTSADVVLLTDNLLLLPPTIRLCRQTDRTMKEGFVFAIAVKVMAIVLAILGLLTFWQAVLIDIGTLLIVVVNGTKALWWFTSFEVRVTTAKGVGNGGKGDVYELAPSAVGLEMV